MNRGDVETVNGGVSDRYLGVFCVGNTKYTMRQRFAIGNASAGYDYRQVLKKVPQWAYTDWEWGGIVAHRRSLDGDVVMHALVTEVHALEGGLWMLLRQ